VVAGELDGVFAEEIGPASRILRSQVPRVERQRRGRKSIAARLTLERAQELASLIAAKHGLFDCDTCAKAIAKKLGKDFGASFERLRTADNTDPIGLATKGILISTNRVHVGVRVGDLIFDNIHHEGVPAIEWPHKFVTATGAPLKHQSMPTSQFFGKIFLAEKFSRWFSSY
jgi:hypothetical protein